MTHVSRVSGIITSYNIIIGITIKLCMLMGKDNYPISILGGDLWNGGFMVGHYYFCFVKCNCVHCKE